MAPKVEQVPPTLGDHLLTQLERVHRLERRIGIEALRADARGASVPH